MIARTVAGSGRIAVILGLAVALASAAHAADDDPRSTRELAQRILNQSGIRGGLVVHVGCGDGTLTAALRASESYLVHGLDTDAKNIERARGHVQSLGRYGSVAVRHWTGEGLPYADNLVNLIVVENPGDVQPDELLRVLVPGGVACVKQGGQWVNTVKPWPSTIDEWTHWMHAADGNAVAGDSQVGPPRHLQWTAKPFWSRHHDTVPSTSAMVSAGGRLFYISDEAPAGLDGSLPDRWSLVARDAFNGVLLWKRPIPQWGWSQWSAAWMGRFNQPTHLPKRLVAVGDTVYVTLGFNAPLTALDAATGDVIRTYQGTECTDEILHHDGLLILAVNKQARTPARDDPSPVHKSVCVIEADTGKMLWKQGDYCGMRSRADGGEPFGRLELAVGDGQIFLIDRDAVIGLDLLSGKQTWRMPRAEVPDYVALFHMRMNDLCVLVYQDGVVLFAQPEMEIRDPWHTIPGTLSAISSKDGKLLWQHRYGGWAHFNQPDVQVINGLVWIHEHQEVQEGRDGDRHFIAGKDQLDYAVLGLELGTGNVKQRFSTRETFNVGHHHRCYRNKATERFLLTSRRGVEFLDLESGENRLHHWARGACLYGVLPCNGMLYLTPHPCDCYIATKLNGYFALAPASPTRDLAESISDQGRLQRGGAYDTPPSAVPLPPSEDWPTYRCDSRRSGSTPTAVAADVKLAWQAKIGGRLSPPVAAGGKLLVASIDEHCVIALDAAGGEPIWDFTAGGRVDTPPTIYRDRVLFGSADGWVYCLRARDGELVWRHRVAPREQLVGAYGQLESAWPVHGSILVQDSVAYLAAGRSSYLDGGIYLYALDPETGKVLDERVIYSPDPETGKMPPGDAWTIPGALADILVGDGSSVYMRQMSVFGKKKAGRHVFSTAGLRDNAWFNRTRWAVGAVAQAQLLVFDDDSAYGIQAYPDTRSRRFFYPGGEGYLLFAAQLKPTTPRRLPGGTTQSKNQSTAEPRWALRVPIRATSMVLAGGTLFLAGPPDTVNPADPLGTFEGRKGTQLWAVSASDGKKLAETTLDCLPVFDGMIASHGRLYLSTADGRVLCLAGD